MGLPGQFDHLLGEVVAGHVETQACQVCRDMAGSAPHVGDATGVGRSYKFGEDAEHSA